MPKSAELKHVNSLNFMNLNPDEAYTKGSDYPLEEATITLDYILAGPAYYAFDPYLAKDTTNVISSLRIIVLKGLANLYGVN